MRRTIVACIALWLAASATAQLRIPLDGPWELAVETDAALAPVFDRTVVVPSAFETALGTAFDGVAWYRRKLPLLPEWRGAAVRIEFAAVATEARIRCNGQDLGEHLGGWTPFRVDLTAALRWDGSDVLEVRVDEKVGHDTQGFLPVVQPHFGGIWQAVTLCIDRAPVLDRLSLSAFGRWTPAAGVVTVQASVLPCADARADRLAVELFDGSRVLARADAACALNGPSAVELAVPAARPWSPDRPDLYTLRVAAVAADGTELDAHERRLGFRSLRAAGTTVLWNEQPLQIRGILHWGYSPPHLAPPSDRDFWRRQLEDFRSLGFNCLKCCLFVPPPCVYELADELGMLVWQEYPTWHARIDAAHRQQLLDEYAGFFALDGGHPAVGFRSITCETGHGADLAVVQALFDACHAAVPETLVVDDSSWLGWQRVTDFWDEHPYGNNRWWPGRLAAFGRHQAEHGEKPLLLGECIAADTWVDSAAWRQRFPGELPWWRPDCLEAMAPFEAWVRTRFGADTLAAFGPIARDHALRMRRYQIERLRQTIPDAGYVVSVARDFGKARMGLYDDFDRLKWQPHEFAWHGDSMLCLEDDHRAFVVGATPVAPTVRVARGRSAARAAMLSPPVPLPPLPRVATPTRHRIEAAAQGCTAGWDVWLLPPFDDAMPPGVRVVDRLDAATLEFVEAGGRALLRVEGRPHSLRSDALWYLRGAPWAPPHPVHERLPLAMLLELQTFDLDGGRLLPWTLLRDEVDPILAFWETHDLAAVRAHLFAFDCRIGAGRLLASAFDRHTPAGRYVEHQLLEHLALGPAPARAWSTATLAAVRELLAERTVPLADWRFRTDADDAGRAAGWSAANHDAGAAPWRDLRAGAHWENQAEDLRHYTGIAWYRIDVELPADWPAQPVRAVFEGVDDSFELWLDGVAVGRRGDPATGTSIWLEPQVLELGQLTPGRHSLALRVVDHAGSGGLWKPAYLTTGPTGAVRDLLQ